ncbi:MAG: DUF192 domain-containing protein [Atopobiaceae bacterium]|nr:DUF192 domain-containing protein [Atopobiaceae bacterium]
MDDKRLMPRVASTWWQRLIGLLGTDEGASCLLLVNCWSIHTFGMRYAIDVAFVSSDGEVLRSERGVEPGRVLTVRGATSVFERPSSITWWPQMGERLSLSISACEDNE